MAGPLILGPAVLSDLSIVAAAITCIANLVAFTTALAIASLLLLFHLPFYLCDTYEIQDYYCYIVEH